MHAPHTNDRPVTIGWLGSPSTVKYLRVIEPVLQDIARRYPQVRWEIMGGNDFRMDGVDWQLSDWSLEGELAALARFDIGLMPLPPEDWARGKSGGKARTYMAAGVAPVVSAIPLMLSRFRESGIRATWATVGLLFARNRTEMLDHAPALRPAYGDASLSPYPAIEMGLIGEDEQADPLHFGASLLDRIAGTEGQEIATHIISGGTLTISAVTRPATLSSSTG